jgi:hypothetical protein
MVEDYAKLGARFLGTSMKIWLTARRHVPDDRILRVVR